MTSKEVYGQLGVYRFLCIGCLEAILGRKLCRDDFNFEWPIMTSPFRRSAKLLERLEKKSLKPLDRLGYNCYSISILNEGRKK